MWLLYLITLPIGIGITFYFKAFFKRMLSAFGADYNKKSVKAICIGAAVLLGLLSLNILRFGAILVLHLLVTASLVQLCNYIFKKCFKDRYKRGFGVWKKLYAYGVIPVTVTAVLLTAGYFNMHNVIRTDYTVYTDKAISDDGYRVVLVADVHYGVSLDKEELMEKCNEISDLKADLIVLCGDIVDSNTTKKEMETVFEVFSKAKSKYGVFYVYGNHDRGHRHGGHYTDDELKNAIESNGITILEDEVYALDGTFYLVGRNDRGYSMSEMQRKSIKELTEDIDESKYVLALDHQPLEYAETGKANVDLLLSGHTHGGQIWPMNIIFRVFGINDAVYGRVQIDEDTEAIVTSGFAGWSYPTKTAAPSEYVVIDIKKK